MKHTKVQDEAARATGFSHLRFIEHYTAPHLVGLPQNGRQPLLAGVSFDGRFLTTDMTTFTIP